MVDESDKRNKTMQKWNPLSALVKMWYAYILSQDCEERKRIHIEVKSRRKSKQIFYEIQECMPARRVLYFLSFSGFLVSFMMRNDINIAIVAMVKFSKDLEVLNNTNKHCVDNIGNVTVSPNEKGEFDWDSTTQSVILSSFYWSYIFSQVAGGALSQRFGTKIVFGGAQLTTALCSLLISPAADFHYSAIVVLRCIQGVASGLTWPAMFAIVGHWIPLSERSRFMSSFQGMSIGIGLTYPLCGFLIHNFGWRVVFYVTGSIGVLWCGIWWLLAFDTPAQHPRISPEERLYIEENVKDTVVSSKGMPVPWKNICLSPPVWAITITTFGRIWANYTFIIPGPMYIKTVLGFSIQANGLLSGLPFLCSYLSSVVFCHVADYLSTSGKLTLTNVRKLFSAISQVCPGLLVVIIGYVGCDITSAVIAWFVAVSCLTASYAGAMANIVDIAPNLGGPILSFAQTFHMTASFLSPLAAGALTPDKSVEQWRAVFWVTAAVAIGTLVFYFIFGTAEVQKWNYPKSSVNESLNGTAAIINGEENDSQLEQNSLLEVPTKS